MAPSSYPPASPYRCVCGGTSCGGSACFTFKREEYINGRRVTTEQRWKDGSSYTLRDAASKRLSDKEGS